MIGRWAEPPVQKDEPGPRGFDDYDLRIGDIMRGERATMGKSLLDVQRELKIKASFIAAIENADVSAFETPGFVAGFVRSYARYLNLDPEWAYAKFREEANFSTAHGMSAEASGPKARAPKLEAPARPAAPRDPFADPDTPFAPRRESIFSHIQPGALGSLTVLIALIGGIGYGGWTVLQEIQRVQFAPVEQAPGVVAEVETLAPELAAVEADGETIETPSPDALNRLYRPQALDVPVMTARDGPIASIDPSSVGALVPEGRGETSLAETAVSRSAPAAPSAPAAGPAAPEDGGGEGDVRVLAEAEVPEVVMFAVRPSWVRVRAADGTVLFEKILDAGERYVLPETEEPPTLRAGNAGSVYFMVNGETYGPAGDGPAVVKNVSLAATALTGSYEVADVSQDSDLAKIIAIAEALETAE